MIEHCLIKDCDGEIYGLFVCEKHYKEMVREPNENQKEKIQ